MNHKHDYQLFKNTNNETKHFDHASVVRLPMGNGTELRHLAQLRVGTNLLNEEGTKYRMYLPALCQNEQQRYFCFQFSEYLKQKIS